MKRRLLALMAALLVFHGMVVSAAAAVLPDLSEKGSLLIRMTWDGENLSGGAIRICRIAEIDEETAAFVPVAPLQGEDLSLKDPTDLEVAKKAAELVGEKQMQMTTAPIESGKARFQDLQTGLYLVLQEEADAVDGFVPIMPYLISIPYLTGEVYSMHVESAPKVPLEPKPTEPTQPEPTKPGGSDLPQTGQLNWPVPMLVIGGLVLFLLGWVLYYDGQKKKQ